MTSPEQTPPKPLPTVDQAASIADKAVVDIVQDLIPLAEAAAIAQVPLLGAPFIKQIWEAVFKWVCDLFGSAAGLLTGFVVMDIQKAVALEKCAHAISAINAAKQSGDKDAIDKASDQADAAAAGVLHYIGSVKRP